MSRHAKNTLMAGTPQVSRSKRPIRHRVYAKSKENLKVKSKHISWLMNRAIEQMPWLKDEDVPAVRQWAELETIRRCALAGIVQGGVLSTKDGEVSVKRLVHDLRQLALAQLIFERELGMTPLARAQLKDEKDAGFDLVSLMAQQQPEPETELIEPNSEPELVEPDGEPETETVTEKS
jgi:hypothetical protein